MPTGVYERHRRSIEEQFWARVNRRSDTECWPWTGSLLSHRGGYGSFQPTGRKAVRAHRFSYELLVGPIPAGLVIDHLCRNPPCVNPKHLQAVPHRTNTLRGVGISAANARKTHCPQGHPYNEENTFVRIAPNGNPQRYCRPCRREVDRRYRERKRRLRMGAA